MNAFVSQMTTKRQERIVIRKWIFSTTCKLCLSLFVVVLGVLYLVKTSSTSAVGFELTDLRKQAQTLEQENERLELEVANYSSMESIQQRLKGMDLVADGEVKYIIPVGSAVARR